MATTKSRAHQLCKYAKQGVEDAIQADNCKILVCRINWEELREEDSDLYERAYQAAKTLGLSDLLTRACMCAF